MNRLFKTITTVLASLLIVTSLPLANSVYAKEYSSSEEAKAAWDAYANNPTSDSFTASFPMGSLELYEYVYNSYNEAQAKNCYTLNNYFTYRGYSTRVNYERTDTGYNRVTTIYHPDEVINLYGSAESFQNARRVAEQVADIQGWANLSGFNQVNAICTWMCAHISYDYSFQNHSLRSALDGSTVCEGYAQLFQAFAEYLGITSRIVVGYLNGGGHAWNAVNFNGRWYFVDVTNVDQSYGMFTDLIMFGADYATNPRNGYALYTYTTDLPISGSNFNRNEVVVATATPVPTNTNTPTPTPIQTVASVAQVRGFVQRLYTGVFNRSGDASGVEYYVNLIKNGSMTGARAASLFLDSPEFANRNTTNEEFLRVLYTVFFDRNADQGGLNYWLNQLSSGRTRSQVITDFINSTEWANICFEYGIASGSDKKPNITITPSAEVREFATRLYTTCLNRPGDAGGINYWGERIANRRISGTEAARYFFFGEEFTSFNLEDQEFIARLYRTMYGREYDQGGMNYWLGRMNNGMSRAAVFANFGSSQEWSNICSDYGILM